MEQIITTTVLKIDQKDKANRIYSRKIVENIVANFKKGTIGVIGSPEGGALNIKDASHLIEDLRIEGNSLVADIKVLNTPAGKILESMINDVSFRCCGLGSITSGKNQEDGNTVNEDYKLTTIYAISKSGGLL